MPATTGYLAIAMVPRQGDAKDPAFRGGGMVDPKQYDHSRFIDWQMRWKRTTPPRTLTTRLGLVCEKPPLRKRSNNDPPAPPP